MKPNQHPHHPHRPVEGEPPLTGLDDSGGQVARADQPGGRSQRDCGQRDWESGQHPFGYAPSAPHRAAGDTVDGAQRGSDSTPTEKVPGQLGGEFVGGTPAGFGRGGRTAQGHRERRRGPGVGGGTPPAAKPRKPPRTRGG